MTHLGVPDHESGVSPKIAPSLADAVAAAVTDPTLIEPSPVIAPRTPTHDGLRVLDSASRDHLFVPIAVLRGVAAFAITVAVGLAAFAIADAYDRLAGDPQSQTVLTVALVTMVLATLVALIFPRMYSARLFADEANLDDELDSDDDWL